jgi:hypothetical protein
VHFAGATYPLAFDASAFALARFAFEFAAQRVVEGCERDRRQVFVFVRRDGDVVLQGSSGATRADAGGRRTVGARN